MAKLSLHEKCSSSKLRLEVLQLAIRNVAPTEILLYVAREHQIPLSMIPLILLLKRTLNFTIQEAREIAPWHRLWGTSSDEEINRRVAPIIETKLIELFG